MNERIPITEHALRKAETYARLAPGHEIFGFLLGAPEHDIVDDVLLAPRQTVSPVSVVVDPLAVLDAGRRIAALRKRCLGVFHSHAKLPTFHSAVDDSNASELVEQLAPANFREEFAELTPSLVTPDTLRFHAGHETFELFLQGGATLDDELLRRIRLRRRSASAKAYSLVVNALGDDPYGEVFAKTWCAACGAETVSHEQARVDVVDAIDEEAMRNEIRASIVPRDAVPLLLRLAER